MFAVSADVSHRRFCVSSTSVLAQRLVSCVLYISFSRSACLLRFRRFCFRATFALLRFDAAVLVQLSASASEAFLRCWKYLQAQLSQRKVCNFGRTRRCTRPPTAVFILSVFAAWFSLLAAGELGVMAKRAASQKLGILVHCRSIILLFCKYLHRRFRGFSAFVLALHLGFAWSVWFRPRSIGIRALLLARGFWFGRFCSRATLGFCKFSLVGRTQLLGFCEFNVCVLARRLGFCKLYASVLARRLGFCERGNVGAKCSTSPQQGAAPDRLQPTLVPRSGFRRRVSLALCVAHFSGVISAITLQVLAARSVLFLSRKLAVNFMFQGNLFT